MVTAVILVRTFLAGTLECQESLGSRSCRNQPTSASELRKLQPVRAVRSDVKRVTNLLHLLIGAVLLAIGAYSFRELAHGGSIWWQRQSFAVAGAHPAGSAKSGSAGDHAVQSPAKRKVSGMLAQLNDAADGDDAVAAPSSDPPLAVDRVGHINAVDAMAPNHFLHRRFRVQTFEFFEFDVPPHASRPELEGTFQSVATEQNPDGGPSVEVLLMNDEEFSRLVNHRPVTAMSSLKPSSGGEIHWKVGAPAGNPQKYYLVFRNPPEAQGPSLVDADFTASFE